MDWEKASKELAKKLDPGAVKPPPQGKYGEYIEGWYAISEANRIFGFDGWSYTSEFKCVSQEINAKGNHVVGYMAKCTLTVDGVTREDIGFGSGVSKQIADAHEGAAKEAVTDALKRSLRTFGNQFGLALYDKTKANVGVDTPEFDPAAARDRIKQQIERAKTKEKLTEVFNAFSGKGPNGEPSTSAMIKSVQGGEPLYNEIMAAFKSRGDEVHDDLAGQAPVDETPFDGDEPDPEEIRRAG